MTGDITIDTARLSLIRLTLEDAAGLFGYRSLPEVCRYQSFRPSAIDDAVAFIAGTAAQADIPDTWYQLGIFQKSNSSLIGDIGIHFLGKGGGNVELGCTLTPASQGQGYATEAVSAVIDYLFQSLGKRRAIFSIDPRNAPSRRLAARLGMRQVAYMEKNVLIDGELCDDVLYEINPFDWMSNRPRTAP